jgi:hypothetical protein
MGVAGCSVAQITGGKMSEFFFGLAMFLLGFIAAAGTFIIMVLATVRKYRP